MAKKNENPDEIVHLQVAEDSTAVYGGISYGSGATLQVRRGDLDRVDGKYTEVHHMRSPTWPRESKREAWWTGDLLLLYVHREWWWLLTATARGRVGLYSALGFPAPRIQLQEEKSLRATALKAAALEAVTVRALASSSRQSLVGPGGRGQRPSRDT